MAAPKPPNHADGKMGVPGSQGLPFDFTEEYSGLTLYPGSVNRLGDGWAFMAKNGDRDVLIVMGAAAKEYEGDRFENAGLPCVCGPLSAHNAQALRGHFPFAAPVPALRQARSFGLGDRLGLAAGGHLAAMDEYDAYPVLAQQSTRELDMTHRSYEEVLDAASYGVFRHGYKRGFGADGDHLKDPRDVARALKLGFTMLTLDCSEHIRGDVNGMDAARLAAECPLPAEAAERYLGKVFDVGRGHTVTFTDDDLRRCILIYGKAVDFAVAIFNEHVADKTDRVDFEISIDETSTPTEPLQYFYIASELTRRHVKFATVAPRFCGEFQKGVDYIGDLEQFEREISVHAAIAEHFGHKLSIHSGSDKFAVYPFIGSHTRGRFHVKTAGTSWLVAMQVVARVDPGLYRRVHKHALARFEDAQKSYHVTTDISRIPGIDALPDEDLPGLFRLNDVRQLIHITYGFILSDKDGAGNFLYRDELYRLWNENSGLYAAELKDHIGKHLKLLYQE